MIWSKRVFIFHLFLNFIFHGNVKKSMKKLFLYNGAWMKKYDGEEPDVMTGGELK